MLTRNLLAVAAAGGLALGTLTGMAWHPRMTMAPLRPWQGAGRSSDSRDFQPVDAWRDLVPVANLNSVPPSFPQPVYQPIPRLALADDNVPQRPFSNVDGLPSAHQTADDNAADSSTIEELNEDQPPLDGVLAEGDY